MAWRKHPKPGMQGWTRIWQILDIKKVWHKEIYIGKKIVDDLMILVIFFDDIIFGGNDKESEKFAEEMKKEFEMSMIREMKYFLGL